MERGKVEAILRYYRDADKAIGLNERLIKNLESRYYTTPGSQPLDGMPRGVGGVSNPVERAALNIPRPVSCMIAELMHDNAVLEKVKAEIFAEINRLDYHQKAVVLGFYADGEKWERIGERLGYSPRQCRYIRDGALAVLGRRFARNPSIVKHALPC